MGLDCRYCHNTVEDAGFAAIPANQTCMNCHANLDLGERQRRLQPLFDSWEGKSTLEWVKVHMLPDYAYFNHSVHLNAGVGCSSCHGRIDQMVVVYQAEPLSMSWCLDCHRDPTPHLRPVDQVTNMAWFESDAAKSYDPAADPTRKRRLDPRHVATRIDHCRFHGARAPDQRAILLDRRDRDDHRLQRRLTHFAFSPSR
jgi:hypothetical protein